MATRPASRLPPALAAVPEREPEAERLGRLCAALAAGAALPEATRLAGRALGCSLVVLEAAGSALAAATRSPVEERALLAEGAGVVDRELAVGGREVGRLRLLARGAPPSASLVAVVALLLAGEVERLRAPQRASSEAVEAFVGAVLRRELRDPAALAAGASEVGLRLDEGVSALVLRAQPHAPVEGDWRARMRAVVERSARGPGALTAAAPPRDPGAAELLLLVPGGDDGPARRLAEGAVRDLVGALPELTVVLGRSRVAREPGELARAAAEALLAANVAATGPERGDGAPASLAFDETGAYRLMLSAFSEDTAELRRFYADTLEPLVAYDEQYETSDLVGTLQTFLDCDAGVAQTAARLYTHRHTVKYRLDRVRELTGLDVGSTDGREKLSLGLKAMRVLGIAAAQGPATESGTEAGRIRRGGPER